jgi:hypothetical protein
VHAATAGLDAGGSGGAAAMQGAATQRRGAAQHARTPAAAPDAPAAWGKRDDVSVLRARSDGATATPLSHGAREQHDATFHSRYVGVSRAHNGVTFRAQFPLAGCGRARVDLGCRYATEEAAARAHDAEARKRGALHRLNFPVTAAEREAASEYRLLGPSAWHATHGALASAGAGAAPPTFATAAVQAPRKRSRARGPPPVLNARMQALSGYEPAAEASDEHAVAVCGVDALEVPDAAGGSTEQLSAQAVTKTEPIALVEAFLRNMSPSLSQARALRCAFHA